MYRMNVKKGSECTMYNVQVQDKANLKNILPTILFNYHV